MEQDLPSVTAVSQNQEHEFMCISEPEPAFCLPPSSWDSKVLTRTSHPCCFAVSIRPRSELLTGGQTGRPTRT
jgi:hypothetical protein